MKLKILNLNKTEIGSIELPIQFNEPLRRDLIKKSVLAIQSRNRQPYGADPRAGLRASADLSRRRRKYRGSYGMGISRVPRKILSRRGTRMNWVGAVMPGTVGGRRAHPPKADKIWAVKINKTENRKAIRSALAGSVVKSLVEERGHKVPQNYPFIIEDKITEIKKTKDLKDALNKLGFEDDLQRAIDKGSKSVLIVVANELIKPANNLPGVEVVKISEINTELLAPGSTPARMTLFTQSAIKELSEKGLFTKDFKGVSGKKIKQVPEKKPVKAKPVKAAVKPVKKEAKTITKKEEKTKIKTEK
jgi:large subunit ribosomal protein L4e